jgi:SAM-dependent methyltransferase
LTEPSSKNQSPGEAHKSDWYREFIGRHRPDYRFSWQIYSQVLEENLRYRKSWLDLGCGSNIIIAENPIQGFKIGLDREVHPRLESRQFCAGDAYHLPFVDQSFDLITSRYLLEHLQEPERMIKEVSRTLRPQGSFLLQTTNRKNLWTRLSRLIPFSFKKSLFEKLHLADITGVHETLYRMNYPELFPEYVCGMKLERLFLIEDLLRFGKLIFWASYLYLSVLEWLGMESHRSNILAVYRKL